MEDFQRIQLLVRDREDLLDSVRAVEDEIVALIPGARRERYSMEAIARQVGVTRQSLYSWIERTKNRVGDSTN